MTHFSSSWSLLYSIVYGKDVNPPLIATKRRMLTLFVDRQNQQLHPLYRVGLSLGSYGLSLYVPERHIVRKLGVSFPFRNALPQHRMGAEPAGFRGGGLFNEMRVTIQWPYDSSTIRAHRVSSDFSL